MSCQRNYLKGGLSSCYWRGPFLWTNTTIVRTHRNNTTSKLIIIKRSAQISIPVLNGITNIRSIVNSNIPPNLTRKQMCFSALILWSIVLFCTKGFLYIATICWVYNRSKLLKVWKYIFKLINQRIKYLYKVKGYSL